MNAKEYLQQIRKLDLQIHNKQLEKEEIWNRMQGCAAISYEPKIGAPGTPNTKSPQEKYFPILESYEKEIAEDIDRLIDVKREVMAVIDSLDDPDEINLLYMRYLQYLKWEEIALKMNFSYMHVHRIHGKALQSVEEKMLQYVTK